MVNPLFPLAWEAPETADEQKTPGALHAALGRICKPKPASGKLEVSPEIHKQWAAGGKSRKALLDILVKYNGDKEPKLFNISRIMIQIHTSTKLTFSYNNMSF